MVSNNVESVKKNKKLGLGSLSFLLVIVGILFSFTIGEYGAIGDHILRFIGISPWSNGETGTHMTLFYSVVFYIPGFIIGSKYKGDFGAETGRSLSLILILSLLALLIITVI